MGIKIYIVLSQNYTILSRLISFITNCKYSHVSISFNKECTDMRSIGRTFKRWPLSGKYRKESICEGVFNKKKSKILVYELEISKRKYNNIINLLNEYGSKCRGYNTIGLFFAVFNKKLDRNKYYCSEFVYKILSNDKVNIFPKKKGVIKPMDFSKIKKLKKVYEGKTIDYQKIEKYGVINEIISI